MKLAQQFKEFVSEVWRLFSAGYVSPAMIERQLDTEEIHDKLRAVCAEHYETALAWIEFRRQWGSCGRQWLEAARDEYEFAIRYGPHTVAPHPDKIADVWAANVRP